MQDIITNEMLHCMVNAAELTIDQMQGSCLAKVTIAYNWLADLLETERHFLQPGVNVEEMIRHNMHCESFRMVVANYLVVLIGSGKNDKISIYKEATKTDYGKAFYNDYQAEINTSKGIRDTIYSHADLDFEKKTKSLKMGFIKTAIWFVCKCLDIPHPKVKPKDSDRYFYISYEDFKDKFKNNADIM